MFKFLKQMFQSRWAVGIWYGALFGVSGVMFCPESLCNEKSKICKDFKDAEFDKLIYLSYIFPLMFLSLCISHQETFFLLPTATVFINIPTVIRFCFKTDELIFPKSIYVIALIVGRMAVGVVITIILPAILVSQCYSWCKGGSRTNTEPLLPTTLKKETSIEVGPNLGNGSAEIAQV